MPQKSSRRLVLKVTVLFSMLAGCRALFGRQADASITAINTATSIPPTDDSVLPTLTPKPSPATPIRELITIERFELLDQAVNYSGSSNGCEQTILRGFVNGATRNTFIRVRPQNGGVPRLGTINGNGSFTLVIEESLIAQRYIVQLTNETGSELYSAPVIVEAIPDCNHNLIEVKFIEI